VCVCVCVCELALFQKLSIVSFLPRQHFKEVPKNKRHQYAKPIGEHHMYALKTS